MFVFCEGEEMRGTTEVGGYALGQPIPLEDFLALVSDGVRYDRDDAGRLIRMAPDHPDHHRYPLGVLCRIANRLLEPGRWVVLPEPGVALPVVRDLQGALVPESRLGPKQLEPDLVVFAGRPRTQKDTPSGVPVTLPAGLRLVVELLSPSTFRQDLGLGQADQVDRWRSYWESEVPELWILNPGCEGLPLPPRSGLFLQRGRSGWEPLPVEGGQELADEVRGLRPLASGVVRSQAVPGLTLDLDAYWRELD